MPKESKHLKVPNQCPLCGEEVLVTRISCDECGSEIHGNFRQAGLGLLPEEYQRFIEFFLLCRGNLKAVEKELGISYPTINKMLDRINSVIGTSIGSSQKLTRREILDAIEKGEMSVQDATLILKNQKRV